MLGGGGVESANCFALPGYVVIYRCYRNLVIRAGQRRRLCAGYKQYSALSDAGSNTQSITAMALANGLTLAAVALVIFSGATLADYPQTCER
jgi:hypothetical protein